MDRPVVADRRWRVVKEWMVRQVESGEWAAHAKLPSIRTLTRLFGTSIGTVQRALAELEAQAYVRAEPRVGYFVSPAAVATTRAGDDFSSVTVDVNRAVVAMLAKAANPRTISLSSAVLHSELTPHTLLSKCLAALAGRGEPDLAGLIPPPGLGSLRRLLAGVMPSRGVLCGPDDILITSGDTVALELALEAVARPGATVAIETPTYYGILQTIERLGMRALPIKTDARQGIDLDHLQEALALGKVEAIFLNPTLQNPRGFIMPDLARARLSELARAAGVPIIEDDPFFDLVPEALRPRAIKGYDTTGQTIYCSSFSKTVAPGYRVGWCVAGRYHKTILAQLFSQNLAVSSLAQWVLSEFLGRGYLAAHCARLRLQLGRSTDYLARCVANAFPQGTGYVPPVGGFVHWLDLPPDTHKPTLGRLLDAQGYPLADSAIFYADGRACNGVRLCLGRPLTPDLQRALDTLAACAHRAQVP